MTNKKRLVARDIVIVTISIVVITLFITFDQLPYATKGGSFINKAPTSTSTATVDPFTDNPRPYPLTKKMKTFTSFEGGFSIDIPVDWVVGLRVPPPQNGISSLTLEELRGQFRQSSFQYLFYAPEDQINKEECDRNELVSYTQCNVPFTFSIDAGEIHPKELSWLPDSRPASGNMAWNETDETFWGYYAPGQELRGYSSTNSYSISIRDVDRETLGSIIDSFRLVDFAAVN